MGGREREREKREGRKLREDLTMKRQDKEVILGLGEC